MGLRLMLSDDGYRRAFLRLLRLRNAQPAGIQTLHKIECAGNFEFPRPLPKLSRRLRFEFPHFCQQADIHGKFLDRASVAEYLLLPHE